MRAIGNYPGMAASEDPEFTPEDAPHCQSQSQSRPVSAPAPRASQEERTGPMGKRPKDMQGGLKGGMYNQGNNYYQGGYYQQPQQPNPQPV